MSPRNSPISAFPVLGLQEQTTRPDLFGWVLETELGSSCLWDRCFTDWAIISSPLLILGIKEDRHWGRPALYTGPGKKKRCLLSNSGIQLTEKSLVPRVIAKLRTPKRTVELARNKSPTEHNHMWQSRQRNCRKWLPWMMKLRTPDTGLWKVPEHYTELCFNIPSVLNVVALPSAVTQQI